MTGSSPMPMSGQNARTSTSASLVVVVRADDPDVQVAHRHEVGLQREHPLRALEQHRHPARAVVGPRHVDAPRRRRSGATSRSCRGRRRRPGRCLISGGAAKASRSPRLSRTRPAPHSCTSSPSCWGCPPASSQACALPDRRVSRERQLQARREDPQPVVGVRVRRLEQERRLGQVRPARERRHLLVAEPVRAVHDRDRVAEERLAGEDVDLAEAAHAREPSVGWLSLSLRRPWPPGGGEAIRIAPATARAIQMRQLRHAHPEAERGRRRRP